MITGDDSLKKMQKKQITQKGGTATQGSSKKITSKIKLLNALPEGHRSGFCPLCQGPTPDRGRHVLVRIEAGGKRWER